MNTKSDYLHTHKDEIIFQYLSGESFRQIASRLGINKDTLRSYMSKWGVPSRVTSSGWNKPMGNNKKYTRNSFYFSTPNPENSYWAGFIAADGNITDYGSVRIALDSKDHQALVQFRDALEFSGEIHKYKYNREKHGTYERVEICDPQIVYDLESVWNITKRKTFTLMPPNITEVHHVVPYIVGYIDGDGSIGKSGNSIRFQICGNLLFLSWVRECISFLTKIKIENNISSMKSIYSLRFQGEIAERLIDLSYRIYSGFRLERKWAIEK